MNDRGVESPIEGKGLHYVEGTVYSQFYDTKVRESLVEVLRKDKQTNFLFLKYEIETESKLCKVTRQSLDFGMVVHF